MTKTRIVLLVTILFFVLSAVIFLAQRFSFLFTAIGTIATILAAGGVIWYTMLTRDLLLVSQQTRKDGFMPVLSLSAEYKKSGTFSCKVTWVWFLMNVGYGPAFDIECKYWWKSGEHESKKYDLDLKPKTRNVVKQYNPADPSGCSVHEVELEPCDKKTKDGEFVDNDPNALHVLLEYKDIEGKKFQTLVEGRVNKFDWVKE